jgi:putative ABC transport system permease protein
MPETVAYYLTALAGSHKPATLVRRRDAIRSAISSLRAVALPRIEAVGMTDMLPLDRNRQWGLVTKKNAGHRKEHGAFVYVVTPGYLETMGMRLRGGP